jgi:hypothetical protein
MHRIVSGRTRRFLRWKACTEEMAHAGVTAIEITGTGPLSSWEFRFLLVPHTARIIWLRRWMHIGHSMGSTTIARNLRTTIPHCRIVRAAGGWSPSTTTRQYANMFRRPRESGDPVVCVKKTLDSRFRGKDGKQISMFRNLRVEKPVGVD